MLRPCLRAHCVQAYMYGMFKNKRIVLFDTLIEQCSEEQVVAVLAHELGVLRTGTRAPSSPCGACYP